MPTFVIGELWETWNQVDLVCFTSNSITKKDGSLVMGAGSALQAQRHAPGFAATAGAWLTATGRIGSLYGLFVEDVPLFGSDGVRIGHQALGALQTKRHWMEPSSLPLIAYSLGHLCQFLEQQPERFRTVAMPFPGIGYGGLPRAEVLPLLAQALPRHVTIYEPGDPQR